MILCYCGNLSKSSSLLYWWVNKIPEVSQKKLKNFKTHISNNKVAEKFYLENFLYSVLDNPYLKNSEHIIEFLNSERDQFRKRIKEIDDKINYPVG